MVQGLTHTLHLGRVLGLIPNLTWDPVSTRVAIGTEHCWVWASKPNPRRLFCSTSLRDTPLLFFVFCFLFVFSFLVFGPHPEVLLGYSWLFA